MSKFNIILRGIKKNCPSDVGVFTVYKPPGGVRKGKRII